MGRSRAARVFIIDDDAAIRELLTRAAARDGLEVIGAVGDGQAALDPVRTARPDLIILDLEMPVLDGVSALPLLLEASPESRIIVHSGHRERRDEVLGAGAHAWVDKGESWSVFRASIDAVLAAASSPVAVPLDAPVIGLWPCRQCSDMHDASTSWVSITSERALVLCSTCAAALSGRGTAPV